MCQFKLRAALISKKMRTRGRCIQLLELREELLLKIIDCMTTTEGRGLLLCCRRLSDLAPAESVSKTAERGTHIISIFELH